MAKSNLSKLYGFDGYDQLGEVTRLGRYVAFFKRRTLLNSEYEPVKGEALLTDNEIAVASFIVLPILVVAATSWFIFM